MVAKKRILLVDDDVEILESMNLVFKSKGYEVLLAQDGEEGLRLATDQEPDVLVLDMMMPKRSGFMVLEGIRKSQVPISIIMITANEGARHETYAEKLGVKEYIRKPFTMDQLVEAVEKQMN